jgi:hypothetical protein
MATHSRCVQRPASGSASRITYRRCRRSSPKPAMRHLAMYINREQTGLKGHVFKAPPLGLILTHITITLVSAFAGTLHVIIGHYGHPHQHSLRGALSQDHRALSQSSRQTFAGNVIKSLLEMEYRSKRRTLESASELCAITSSSSTSTGRKYLGAYSYMYTA